MYYNFLPFLLGVITSFSLPPYNFLLLNFLTFPILFLILVNNKKQTNSSWSSFKIGWFFGIGYFISNIYWIVYSLTFDEIFKFIIPFALIIIPSFLGLFYGLITLLSSKFKLEKNFSSILVFSLTFAIIEFFRGFILGGFPWNLIVYSLTNFLESLQILSITGTYSLNLICITFFLLPLMLIFKKSIRFKILLTTFILITLIFNQLYGYWKIKTDEKYYPILHSIFSGHKTWKEKVSRALGLETQALPNSVLDEVKQKIYANQKQKAELDLKKASNWSEKFQAYKKMGDFICHINFALFDCCSCRECYA